MNCFLAYSADVNFVKKAIFFLFVGECVRARERPRFSFHFRARFSLLCVGAELFAVRRCCCCCFFVVITVCDSL